MRFSLSLLVALAVGLSACGRGMTFQPGDNRLLEAAGPSKVWVSREGERLLSGLIALRSDEAGIYYVVLEAGGLTLVHGFLARSGEHKILQAKPGIVESGLTDLLGDAFTRLLTSEQANASCAGLLPRICRQQQGDQHRVEARFCGLSLWHGEVTYTETGSVERIVYQQALAGLELVIEQ